MAAGVDEQNMLLFVHQLQRLVEDREDNQSCLVFHVHQDTLPEGNETARPSLGKQLPYLANILLQVTALSTGASSDVHGVVSNPETVADGRNIFFWGGRNKLSDFLLLNKFW
eukprot:m.161293 g.161293  ORF g.161293 m.161293 type:complete len:112 (-) comp16373_c7_seq9:227-562(-)